MGTKLIKRILNVNGVVFGKEIVRAESITFHCRLKKGKACRCGVCGRKCKYYDSGRERRTWRTLDLGVQKAFVEMSTYRVICPNCGVRTVKVPWADLKSGFSLTFEQQVAWLACCASKTAVAKQMRISWNTVGEIITRVYSRLDIHPVRRFDGLRRIGIDETSYKKGHKYVTVVVDHDRRCVIWVHEGYGKDVLKKFMEKLTWEQRAAIKEVSCDGARWIKESIEKYLPNAERCVDFFHVVQWATEAMDRVRKDAWHEARKTSGKAAKRSPGRPPKTAPKADRTAEEIKGSKYAFGKAPENLTEKQRENRDLAMMRDPRLGRAYLMKEELRLLLKSDSKEASARLDSWMGWARRSRIKPMVELYYKIKRNYDGILASVRNGISNARIEAINNRIKLIIRTAYGFRNMENMKAMIMLCCSDIEVNIAYKWAKDQELLLQNAA
jgi:transposase